MVESNTTRFAVRHWTADSDTPSRTEIDGSFAQVELLAVGFNHDHLSNRPAPGKRGWFFFDDDMANLYYDTGSSWQQITMMYGGVSASAPGDAGTVGATGMASDSGHVHPREPFGASVAAMKFGLTKTDGSSGSVAHADHGHGTPAIKVAGAGVTARSALNLVIPAPVGAVTDDAAGDQTTVTLTVQPFPIPFHIGNALSTGLKKPAFIAPFNCTVRLAYARVAAGSGATYELYVDGADASGSASGAVGTASVLYDFTDFDMSVGQALQVNVINAGSGASDLSVTALAVPR